MQYASCLDHTAIGPLCCCLPDAKQFYFGIALAAIPEALGALAGGCRMPLVWGRQSSKGNRPLCPLSANARAAAPDDGISDAGDF